MEILIQRTTLDYNRMSRNLKYLIPTVRQKEPTRHPIRDQIGTKKYVYYTVRDFSSTQYISKSKYVYQL